MFLLSFAKHLSGQAQCICNNSSEAVLQQLSLLLCETSLPAPFKKAPKMQFTAIILFTMYPFIFSIYIWKYCSWTPPQYSIHKIKHFCPLKGYLWKSENFGSNWRELNFFSMFCFINCVPTAWLGLFKSSFSLLSDYKTSDSEDTSCRKEKQPHLGWGVSCTTTGKLKRMTKPLCFETKRIMC